MRGESSLHSCWSWTRQLIRFSCDTCCSRFRRFGSCGRCNCKREKFISLIWAHGSSQLVCSYAPKRLPQSHRHPSQLSRSLHSSCLSDSNIRLWHGMILVLCGKRNWVRRTSELDHFAFPLSLSLKQAVSWFYPSSLDKTIRVWRIQEGLHTEKSEQLKLSELVQKNSFTHNNKSFSVLADSLAPRTRKCCLLCRFFTNLRRLNGNFERILGSQSDPLGARIRWGLDNSAVGRFEWITGDYRNGPYVRLLWWNHLQGEWLLHLHQLDRSYFGNVVLLRNGSLRFNHCHSDRVESLALVTS